MQKLQLKQSNVDLFVLSNKIARDFNLSLLFDDRSKQSGKVPSSKLDLVYGKEENRENLNILRNYPNGFESFRLEHTLRDEEITQATYITTDFEYFKKTFESSNINNPFLNFIKANYYLIKTNSGKRINQVIPNDQKTLEELTYYILQRFKH